MISWCSCIFVFLLFFWPKKTEAWFLKIFKWMGEQNYLKLEVLTSLFKVPTSVIKLSIFCSYWLIRPWSTSSSSDDRSPNRSTECEDSGWGSVPISRRWVGPCSKTHLYLSCIPSSTSKRPWVWERRYINVTYYYIIIYPLQPWARSFKNELCDWIRKYLALTWK